MKKQFSLLCIFLLLLIASAHAQTNIERSYLKGENDVVIQLLQAKIEQGKASEDELIMGANCYLNQFKYNEAILTYNKGLLLYPQSVVMMEGLADAQLGISKKTAAMEGYRRLLAIDSSNVRIRSKLAGILTDIDEYKQAKEIYADLYMADSSNVYFLKRLMLVMYKLHEYAYIIQLAKDNQYFPLDNKELQLVLAESYAKLELYGDAFAVMTSILMEDSLYTPALRRYAFYQFKKFKNYEDAVVLYRTLNRAENYEDPTNLRNLAICEYFVGNHEFAAVTLDSLEDVIPDDPFTPFYAGLSYNKLGEIDKALSFLENAALFAIPEYSGDMFHHLGRTYANKRMFKEAIETYEMVRMLDTTNTQVLYDIAVVQEEWQRNSAVALAYYQLFVKACSNKRSPEVKYAENRINRIREELFFEGELKN